VLIYNDPVTHMRLRKAAIDDFKMFQRMARWCLDTYGPDTPRMRQALAELALAAIVLAQARGQDRVRVRLISERESTIAELMVLAKPVLEADYGLPPPKTSAKKKAATKRGR